MNSRQQKSSVKAKQGQPKQAVKPNKAAQTPSANLSVGLNQSNAFAELPKESNAGSWIQTSIAQLQQQHGNAIVQRLLTQPADAVMIQRQDETDADLDPCAQVLEEIRTAFINSAVELDPEPRKAEADKFIKEFQDFTKERETLQNTFEQSKEAVKDSGVKIDQLLSEVELRLTDEFEEQYQAGLDELEAQYEAKKAERDEAEKIMNQKQTALDEMIAYANSQFMQLHAMIESTEDYWFAIDMQIAQDYAQERKEPSDALKEKLDAYKELGDEINAKFEELDKEYQAGMKTYEKAGQDLETAEAEYQQKERELSDIRQQIKEYKKESLEAKEKELQQEEIREKKLKEEYEKAKKEDATHRKEKNVYEFFAHLKDFGVVNMGWVGNAIDSYNSCQQ